MTHHDTTRRVAHLSLVRQSPDAWPADDRELVEELREYLRNHREPRIVAFFREHGDLFVGVVIGFAAACFIFAAAGMGR